MWIQSGELNKAIENKGESEFKLSPCGGGRPPWGRPLMGGGVAKKLQGGKFSAVRERL
jgi:hypothetical protein